MRQLRCDFSTRTRSATTHARWRGHARRLAGTVAMLFPLLAVPALAVPRLPRTSAEPDTGTAGSPPAAGPAEALRAELGDSTLGHVVDEVLSRNPELASLAAQARAAEEVAPQVRSLPDPMAALTAYLLSPETRVGPQRAVLSLSQRFPWFGKLALQEKAATYAAVEARSRLEARRLELVTEARRLYFEVGFLDAWAGVTRLDRETLSHYEELARVRYASGVGLEQAVVKIQAEITKDDNRALDIAKRRAAVVSSLNALRDLPQDTPLPLVELPKAREEQLSPASLRREALSRRPELAAAQAGIERAATLTELARKGYDPDVTLGLTYGLVTPRTDAAGRTNPPPDNGQDVLGVSAAVNLPIWRAKLSAGVTEAVQKRLAAEESKRTVITHIDSTLGDLTQRLPLTWQQVRLFEDVLAIQAEEALHSAESAYAAGTVNALDLLDAERVLLDVRTGTARARADYAIAIARLEGATGGPLALATRKEEH
jgi:cobalt-zinc-cadmium efflux system outer membrane protein